MNQEPGFFDKRTMIAMVLVFIGILGWNYYLSHKYPKVAATTTPIASAPTPSEQAKAPPFPIVSKSSSLSTGSLPEKEILTTYEDTDLKFEVSSRGMGLKNIIIKSHTQRDGSPIVIGKDLSQHYIFETQLKGKQPLQFSIQLVSPHELKGVSQQGETRLEKTIKINQDLQKLEILTTVENLNDPILVFLSENLSKNKSTSFLLPSYDFESFFVGYEGTSKRVDIKEDADHILTETLNNVNVVSLGSHYFTAALVDQSPLAPSISTLLVPGDTRQAVAQLQYDISQKNRTYEIRQEGYLGPKDLHLLGQVNEQLKGVVNYGIFSWIAIPILKLLKFFYSIFGNYGLAIILVTLLIRMLLMPINISSYKSMKSMQKIQPLLKAAKEKYKADPKRLQVETMNIMKENKVNPLGGCLPMLLQLPIFIALYNVLAQSIELYKAPFIFWIHDLSVKDPFYILPILMGISMFVQQKVTPTTMDPAQAKAMQIMPVIFSLFMISLPSGLTLYIFVSTLFGIIQQYLFMSDRKNKNIITMNAK